MIGRPMEAGPGGPALLPAEGGATVCIVLLSGIGDVVHGLPLALDVKDRDPDARVVWVAEPAPAQVLAHHPAVDRVVVYRSRAGFAGLRELQHGMRGVRADMALNVQRYLKSLWPTLLSRAPVRVGLPPSKTRDGIRFAHTHVLPETPWKHTQDLFLDFRFALGVPRDSPVRWEITFSDQERADQTAFFATCPGTERLGLVLASANPKKDWPVGRMVDLVDRAADTWGTRVLLLGGPSERERLMARQIVDTSRSHPMDCTGDSVRRMMWLLDGCDAVVAPDTGPLHIAHALGVPVVGLFAHTNPWRVGPWKHHRDLVVDRYTEPGSAPDPSAYLPRDDHMDAITVEDVMQRVQTALSRAR